MISWKTVNCTAPTLWTSEPGPLEFARVRVVSKAKVMKMSVFFAFEGHLYLLDEFSLREA